MIAEAALQEDVQVVGLSILSGAHLELFPASSRSSSSAASTTSSCSAAGSSRRRTSRRSASIGFAGVFGPGTDTNEIIEFVKSHAPARG